MLKCDIAEGPRQISVFIKSGKVLLLSLQKLPFSLSPEISPSPLQYTHSTGKKKKKAGAHLSAHLSPTVSLHTLSWETNAPPAAELHVPTRR